MSARSSRERGFTLVEMLVVVAVLGVLATVVVLAVRGTQDQSADVGCLTDRNQLITAQAAHYGQYGSYGTEQELVDREIIGAPSRLHDVEIDDDGYTLVQTGPCVGARLGPAAGGDDGDDGGGGGDGDVTMRFASAIPTVTAGVILEPVVVRLAEADGDVHTDPVEVSIALGDGEQDAALAGTTTVTSADGAAVFDDLSISAAGTGHTLVATAAGVTAAVSDPLTVEPAAATALAFTRQRQDVIWRSVMPIQPAVAVVDEYGNTVADAPETPIELRLHSDAGASSRGLQCDSLSATTVDGVAEFSNCQIRYHGDGYWFEATAAGFEPAVGDPLRITHEVHRLDIVTELPNVTAGDALPPIEVHAIDSRGRIVRAVETDIELSLRRSWEGSGYFTDSLHGDLTATTEGGVAVFEGLSTTFAWPRQRLAATIPQTGRATSSNRWAVVPAAASAVGFRVETAGGDANRSWSRRPQVEVLDEFGNTVAVERDVRLEITEGTGAPGAELTCRTNPDSTSSSGRVSFGACRIDLPGEDYTLTARSDDLDPAVSAPFDID